MSGRSLYVVHDWEAQVAETTAAWQRSLPEKLVQCLWFESRWRPTDLRTLDGEVVTVHSPGRWNRHAGPDFQHAVIAFANGQRRRGDVEIHRYASGWTGHRHHHDQRYNQVILHVFLWNDRQASTVRRADGHLVPQIALEGFLSRPLAAYHADIVLEDYPYKHVPARGRCYDALKDLPVPEVAAWLEQAGDTRLQQRMWRWHERSVEVGLAQVMYEAVLRSLGSTGHRQHFQDLARLLPWQEAQNSIAEVPATQRGVAAEALFLGSAGLLSTSALTAQTQDAATQQYARSVQRHWQRLPQALRQRAWQDINWRQPHVRPANTPERRLAGMAQLLEALHHTTLLDAMLAPCRVSDITPQHLCRTLTALCMPRVASYWSTRAHLGGRPGRAQQLIGAQRALTLVVDAVLPVLLLASQHHADSQVRENVLACYRAAPRLPDNSLLRYMRRRLLGDDPALLPLIQGARQQQGLLQLFADFCSNDEGNCQGCEFPFFMQESGARSQEDKILRPSDF